MSKLRIAVVVGSTRIGRFADHPAKWIADIAGKRSELEVETLDLLDYPMALYGEARATEAESETAERWRRSCVSSTATSLPLPNITMHRPPF